MYAFFKSILIFCMLSSSVFAVEVDELRFYALIEHRLICIEEYHRLLEPPADSSEYAYLMGMEESFIDAMKMFDECIKSE